jgi:hypothetical protein
MMKIEWHARSAVQEHGLFVVLASDTLESVVSRTKAIAVTEKRDKLLWENGTTIRMGPPLRLP